MSGLDKILGQMRRAPQNVRYADPKKVCLHYLRELRQNSTSHSVFKTPWNGDQRVNIQDKNGMAKPYQVKQVLDAIERLENETTSK